VSKMMDINDKIQPVYSSDDSVDMDKEYIYHNYRYLRKENSLFYGVGSSEDVRIRPVYFDELCYILSEAGTHLILFGGAWSEKTQA